MWSNGSASHKKRWAGEKTNLPALAGGLYWNTSNLYTLGQIAIAGVPEPGVSALLALGVGMLARRKQIRS